MRSNIRNRNFHIPAIFVLPILVLLLAGCTTEFGPRYNGKVTRLEGSVELPYNPVGKYAFEKTSDVKIETGLSSTGTRGSYFNLSFGRAEVRQIMKGQMSSTTKGPNFVTVFTLDSISVRPIGQSAGIKSESLEATDIQIVIESDKNGSVLDLEIDKSTEGWQRLDSDTKTEMETVIGDLKNLFTSVPEFPRLLNGEKIYEINAADLLAGAGESLPAGTDLAGTFFLKIAGTTNYHGIQHLVASYWADFEISGAETASGVAKGTTRIGGYILFDLNTGIPTLQEEKVLVQISVSVIDVTVISQSKTDITKQ